VVIAIILQALWRLGRSAIKGKFLAALAMVAAAAANACGLGPVRVMNGTVQHVPFITCAPARRFFGRTSGAQERLCAPLTLPFERARMRVTCNRQHKEPPMWSLNLPWWELVLRALIVYAFLIVLLRLTGKRQVGQLAPFDLVLLLVLSNAVQNSMNGGDNTVTAGIILSVTLVGVNFLVGWLTFRSKRLEALVEGRPVILVHNGRVDERAMRQAQMTHHELDAALRADGCAGPNEVRFAVLENNGKVTVVPLK